MKKAKSEEKIVLEYRGRVRQGREQFHKELESIVPDVKVVPRLDGMFITIQNNKTSSFIAFAVSVIRCIC